jgi:hypothetical protein
MHADHAGRERIVSDKAAATHHGDGDRRIDPVRELVELLVRASAHDAAATDKKRTLRFLDHLRQALDRSRLRLAGLDAAHETLRELVRELEDAMLLDRHILVVALRLRDILRDIDEDRTRTSRAGNQEGLAHDICELMDILHDTVPLRDRLRYARDIDFLEGVLAEKLGRDVAGDRNDRRRVHIGRGDAGREVRAAGARRREAHADLAGRTGIAVSGMHGTLLVAHEIVVNLGRLVQDVVDVENRSSGISEDGIASLLLETLDEYLGTCELHASSPYGGNP